nr:MAG TPA: hypothetical protein [Caudoviricetes sp.]DAT21488.1 MAG TPA: hypothetical protein [Caudoviricetes sp.]DAY23877.1 MAG TPA: hypothetical protein [Caudoviricetes sp.]
MCCMPDESVNVVIRYCVTSLAPLLLFRIYLYYT